MADAPGNRDFENRRAAARDRIDGLAGADGLDPTLRKPWFEQVYDLAAGDPAAVPWADLAAKPALRDWLAEHPGNGRSAVDIACGLGDNAEAIAAAGYRTTAFDLAAGAIAWARRRFPGSAVEYRVADLFDLPDAWTGRFDLVHECYTIQSLRGDLRRRAFAAIAALVAPGGRLLVICRSRADGAVAAGPPWPLSPQELAGFEACGLKRDCAAPYTVTRGERRIEHLCSVYRRPDAAGARGVVTPMPGTS